MESAHTAPLSDCADGKPSGYVLPMRLAFSLPVHERPDAVLDTIRNVLHFNPGSIVILHLSQQSTVLDELARQCPPQVLINPTRYRTFGGGGLFLVHSSNYRHLQAQNIEFDAFCLLSSNDMFVRGGLERYAAEVRNGFQAVRLDPAEDWHVFRIVAHHPKTPELLQACGGSVVYGGQTEGQFYERALFGKMADIYFAVYGEEERPGFETEEIVPQTVAMSLGVAPHLPFTLVDYSHRAFEVDLRAIALLSDPARVGAVRLNLGARYPDMLRSPHVHGTNDFVFAVKRIPRDPSHPLRMAIRDVEKTAPPANPGPPGPAKRTVSLVPFWKYQALISRYILLCQRLGLPVEFRTGVRSFLRKIFKRR